MTSEFFNNTRPTFAGYDVTKNQINALKGHLEGVIPIAETIKCLTRHPEASCSPVEMKQRLGGLWTLLNDTAVALCESQPEIISILQRIRTLPKANEPKGEGQEYIDLDDGFYWRELTDWAINWADTFNSHASRFLIERGSTEQDLAERRVAWENACAYSARLAATDDDALASFGTGLDRATRAIAEALETDTEGQEPESLKAAAKLFMYAGSQLWHRCRQGQTDGFSDARWEFWAERWRTLAEKQEIPEKARALAREALQAMEMAKASEL